MIFYAAVEHKQYYALISIYSTLDCDHNSYKVQWSAKCACTLEWKCLDVSLDALLLREIYFRITIAYTHWIMVVIDFPDKILLGQQVRHLVKK